MTPAQQVSWDQAVAQVAAAVNQVGLAEALVKQLSPATLHAVLVATLLAEARRVQRAEVLEVERYASSYNADAARASDRERARAREERGRQHRAQYRAMREANGIPLDLPADQVMALILSQFAARLKLEWTAELLGSSFALRDGTRVTWGQATRDQHLERVDMFVERAEVNMEGAARHEVAVRALQESGARCLDDLVAAQVPS